MNAGMTQHAGHQGPDQSPRIDDSSHAPTHATIRCRLRPSATSNALLGTSYRLHLVQGVGDAVFARWALIHGEVGENRALSRQSELDVRFESIGSAAGRECCRHCSKDLRRFLPARMRKPFTAPRPTLKRNWSFSCSRDSFGGLAGLALPV